MITNISIDSDGRIKATFGAGQSVVDRAAGHGELQQSPGTRQARHRTATAKAAASGLSNVGVAGTGGRGTLIGSALEQSNVDMAQEFTQMILAQRGYQANSKTITVSDQLLVDTLNLKQ